MSEELPMAIRADGSLTEADRRLEVTKAAFTTGRERNKSLFQRVSRPQDLLSACEEENQRLRNLPCQLLSQKEDLAGNPAPRNATRVWGALLLDGGTPTGRGGWGAGGGLLRTGRGVGSRGRRRSLSWRASSASSWASWKLLSSKQFPKGRCPPSTPTQKGIEGSWGRVRVTPWRGGWHEFWDLHES